MTFDKTAFINEILTSPKRKVIPIMTFPGVELAGVSVRDVFQNGRLQFDCIKKLAEALPADAQLTFMDLTVEAEAFGAPVVFADGEAPCVTAPIASDEDAINALDVPAAGTGRTAEVLACARLCAEQLERPTLVGMIGPYSLACRLADMTEMMMMTAAEPDTAHALLRKCTAFLVDYARAIKATGAAGILIAEPAAGLLSPEMCQEFAADYLREIIRAVKDDTFMLVLHNCGNINRQVAALLSTEADALHVGNAVKLEDIMPQVPATVPVMGNLDPVGVFRDMPRQGVYSETMALLGRMKGWPNFVLSSGCDLPPGVPLENVEAFLRAAKDYGEK